MKHAAWKRVIGIVGGLGPHAHIELEREILRCVDWAQRDQEYPPWVLVSEPGTPDRTKALLAAGESPVPFLIEALRTISKRADFAVISCVTAHAFLGEVRSEVAIPILDVPEEAVRAIVRLGRRRIGVLATTGSLKAAIFDTAAQRVDPSLEMVSLLDLPDGETLQKELVMDSIYGSTEASRAVSLKTGSGLDEGARERLAERLREAAIRLIDQGADSIVLGCTEIPLGLGHEPILGVPLVDPIRTAAQAAIEIASGQRDLPAA